MLPARSVEILATHREYDGFIKLDRVTLRHERYDGAMSEPIDRLVVERGDAAAVLLYDDERECVVLVEQFRYPALIREPDDGWLLEVVAGTVDAGRDPEEVAQKELVEEAGYTVQRLDPIGRFFLSPGACTERVSLYLAYVSTADRTANGGGAPGESEDIRLVELPLSEALQLIQQGSICDAKTIIALQALRLGLATRHRKG